jgi:hypothetical protein
MAVAYGVDFGVINTTKLISIWREVMGEDFNTDALRTLVPDIPVELEDNDPLFPRLAARAVSKKSSFVKFVYDELVSALSSRFNGYAQVASAYPKHVDILNYFDIISKMTEKHAQVSKSRRQMTWGELCDTRDGVGKSIWQQFGVCDQSPVFAQ